MELTGKTILVLGGGGMVGIAVCRELLAQQPASIFVASRHEHKSKRATEQLQQEFSRTATRIVPVWGDVFIRAEWQQNEPLTRESVLTNAVQRRRLIADLFDPLDESIMQASLLAQFILGTAAGFETSPAQVVIDCMNTATVIGYQNIYMEAKQLADTIVQQESNDDWQTLVETTLASLYVPQLVRHIQILHRAMQQAGTTAYIKVGTTGTGGMGLNIPYTHGEEKPSRLLLSKAALAGAQTLLTFLMARTPDGPAIVKEIKPAAMIGWREIAFGPISSDQNGSALYDCPPEHAVSVRDFSNLVFNGDFGCRVDGTLEGTYVDTGENGRFSAAEFTAITALSQMQLVTPEEIAGNVVKELLGGNTGHDVVAALDNSVMGPSYRGGYLRQSALKLLHQLEAQHGEAVAFEQLGPPRLSKLLFEAYLLKRVCGEVSAVLDRSPAALATELEQEILQHAVLRKRMLSIGIPVLLADGEQLLRGPVIKSSNADSGWIDLSARNMQVWQQRLRTIQESLAAASGNGNSSSRDHHHGTGQPEVAILETFDIGEISAWIFAVEEHGARTKN